MHRLEASIEINAPAERVWSLLMDFPSYPRWNPFVRSIEGNPAAGESLKVFIQPPGLFDGEHYFKLEPKSSGRVLFHQGEVFSGLLVPLLRQSLDHETKQGFIAMNEALKREAERR